MFKGTITNTTTVAANTNIPLTVVYNTNTNTSYSSSDNTISILKPGFYDFKGQVVLTDVAPGEVSVQLFADGVAIPESIATATSAATTDFITLPITDMLRVLPTAIKSYADLSVQVSVASTIDSAIVIIEKVR